MVSNLPPGVAGPGRPKGSENKATKDFKRAVTLLLESVSDDLLPWLRKVAEKEPEKALDLVAKLAEYAAPKLARSENETKVSGDMTFGWRSKPPEDEK